MGCEFSTPADRGPAGGRLNFPTPVEVVQHKLILVGDIAVGKSSLVQRLLGKEFRAEHVSTIGTAFASVTIKPSEEADSITMQVWDTAGEERYRSMSRFFFRSTQVGILVFDVTVAETLRRLASWHEDIQRISPHASFIVVANKTDCEPSVRVVSKEEGQELAARLSADYVETSAKTGENVLEMFRIAARLSLSNKG